MEGRIWRAPWALSSSGNREDSRAKGDFSKEALPHHITTDHSPPLSPCKGGTVACLKA